MRKVEEKDKPMIDSWISKEPSHSHNSEFYFEPRTNSIIYEDEQGPVLVVRYSSALRFDTDFNPDADKHRIKELMKKEFPGLFHQAETQGFKELVFQSMSEGLIRFCRIFGFSESPDYRKSL